MPTKKLIEGDELIVRAAEAYRHFMREKLYWEILQVAGRFERHPWPRRQSRRDAHVIGEMCDFLREVSNELYLIRLAIKKQGEG